MKERGEGGERLSHNLFKLFFLASIFFLSAGNLFSPPSFFSAVGAAAADPVSADEAIEAGWH